MNWKNAGFTLAGTCAAVLLFVAGCDVFSASEGSGRLQVLITDNPLENVAETRVTIQRVEVVSDDGTSFLLSDEPVEFDLLKLRDGVTAALADEEIPEGTYSRLRIVVRENATIVFTDGSEQVLKVPSGAQTGIQVLFPTFEISGGETVTLTIDFDAERSFVKAGASGMYIFKPVIKPYGMSVNGQVQDLVDDADPADDGESGDDG